MNFIITKTMIIESLTSTIKLIVLTWLFGLPGYIMAQEKIQKKPNIIFFLVDDLGWRDVEPFGTTFYETPNLKQLAKESMRFTNAYAACPVCSPTRASLMTGKYPARTQTTEYFGASQPEQIVKNPKLRTRNILLPAQYRDYLPLEETTIAEALKAGGYTTMIAGKWHLGDSEKYWPENQGFDYNFGGFAKGHPSSYFSPYNNPKLSDGPEGEYLPERLTKETLGFIDNNKNSPFFIYYSFYSVHTPLQAKKENIAKYELKKQKLGIKDEFGTEGKKTVRLNQGHTTYAAMVEEVDLTVGAVIAKLKSLNLYENTIIVFFSDNGGLAVSEGNPTANAPLRAGKGWLYEGGIREPMIIRWPGVTKANSICEEPVVSTDFYPTLLQMAGLPQIPKQHIDGKNLLPLLKQKPMQRRAIYWHYPHYGGQGGAPGSVIRDGDWKLIRFYETDTEELYNLKVDIGEKNNRIDKEPVVLKKLQTKLNKWLVEQKAILPKKNQYYKKES
ncbi:arylsulfatase A-like enzyme [Pedobacter sp. AK017]|uniref:sulfatase n=1 Tax=Pedobacter sp. AK017 TaxID=2723073 RepID=UPI00160CD79D|nr:sulfatase [Pedobacter sp. AK017]MBB5438129.1 arylsulfatase A-like enzyme [Pedobacter sp. AK017]